MSEPAASQEKVSAEERHARFERLLQRELAAKPWRVESRSEYEAALVRGKRTNHVLHLILTIVTGGAWGIVWIGIAVFGGEKRETVAVDEYGNESVRYVFSAARVA